MFGGEDRQRRGNKHRPEFDQLVRTPCGGEFSSDNDQTGDKINEPREPRPEDEMCKQQRPPLTDRFASAYFEELAATVFGLT